MAASEQNLIYAGKPLEDHKTLGDYEVRKESKLMLMQRGVRTYAPSSDAKAKDDNSEGSDDNGETDIETHPQASMVVATSGACSGGAHAGSSASTAQRLQLRRQRDGEPEYDGSDGWAVATHLDVQAAQRWYRAQHRSLLWDDWKNGNRLVYMLNRGPGSFPDEVASFLGEQMGNTAMIGVWNAASKSCPWQSLPACAADIDQQLRSVLADPRHGDVPLLGDVHSGAFVLGYLQISQMPVPLAEEGVRGEARARPQKTGRSLGLHFDSLSYGDLIITVTVFGHVQILLKNRKDIDMPKEFLGLERGSGTVGGDVVIYEGDAYAIFGKARYKMEHDAIVPPNSAAIDGLDAGTGVGAIARVGFTFRYFRRTFLELRRRQMSPHLVLTASPISFKPFDYVDAPYYEKNGTDAHTGAHLYTYIAVVLRVDSASRTLTLQYLSDGLGADTDQEAFHTDSVPEDSVLPAPEAVRTLLECAHCQWTLQSRKLVEHIRLLGVDTYLKEL